MSDHPTTVHSARIVVPMTAPPIADGAVAVRDGRILHVGERSWVVDQLDGTPFTERRWRGALLPGLVNAHSHLQYTGMASVGRGQYDGFEDWAAAFNEEYAEPHDWRAEAAEGAAQSIAAGVTSIADIVTDIEAATALETHGLGGIAYWEVMDWENAAWQEHGRDQVLDELARIPTTPGAGLSPHAPYSLDVAPLLELPDIVRQRGLRLHLHLGEAAFEGERLATSLEHGTDWHLANVPSFRAMRALGFGASATSFVDRLGVLGPDCHIAHGVYMTAADRALLRARGTAVALCPRSNAVIGLDPPPVADYLREGSPIAIGTDSLSSSPSLDLMADVTALHRIARAQGYGDRDLHERLLAAATLGGAHAMGLAVGTDRIGHLAVGARADLAVFDVDARTVPDALAELVEDGAGRAAATVIRGTVRALDGGSEGLGAG
ncbi:cytosine/adenosine deaminase-related metal-dependent hydrolase [Curtobacterium sp. PhB130]|uniref:amidohydrolase family protein n=1 Tax=unclassified Curtobacterium TaxID=257496 RepID=UPI000FB7BE92|nr:MULTISPECIES: amidohydrolase family protein [unclassified Curtobacterium]ROP58788.1 cytosine/adenosine deaminase-related metal-dependent hydrolase [Curtobacterium sp. ZW137]ROS77309.1 cytosine/adenosine deaminase-related metal-dependent hydrolase [Curtobacterium sp. PhB130]TCK66486.1 cytosine/adenosine deaminase-related metal-dependent hydrolase [Curtobacterium sp. PhB136]